jgi:Tfp pilus assembly protein PilF
LGSAYAVGHRYPEAEAEFLEALRIAPNDLNAHFSLGGLYFETGQVRKAAFHLERIIEIDPGSDLGSRIIAQTYHLPQSYVLAARDPIR